MKKLLLKLTTAVAISFAFISNSNAIGTNEENFSNSSNSRKIIALEAEIALLKDRVKRLEENKNEFPMQQSNNTPTQEPTVIISSADSWICKYKGFSEIQYTAIGATKAIAAYKASQKCINNDKNSGFFCRLDSCSN